MNSMRRTCDKWLYARGFISPVVRGMLLFQAAVCAVSLSFGLALLWYTAWPLLFGVGATLAVFNFWHTASFAQTHVRREFTPAMGALLFFGTTARLCLTGILLFSLVVILEQPVVPLLAGLTSLIAVIVLWGFSRVSRKSAKEA